MAARAVGARQAVSDKFYQLHLSRNCKAQSTAKSGLYENVLRRYDLDMKNHILTLIRDHGLSIAEVSRRSGLSRPTIYSMGRADHDPALSSVIALAEAIGCEPADLFPALCSGAIAER